MYNGETQFPNETLYQEQRKFYTWLFLVANPKHPYHNVWFGTAAFRSSTDAGMFMLSREFQTKLCITQCISITQSLSHTTSQKSIPQPCQVGNLIITDAQITLLLHVFTHKSVSDYFCSYLCNSFFKKAKKNLYIEICILSVFSLKLHTSELIIVSNCIFSQNAHF